MAARGGFGATAPISSYGRLTGGSIGRTMNVGGRTMDELLTIDEIKARYAPDWVLIGDPETDEAQHLKAGKVLFHSPDRDEVYQKAIDLRLGNFAFRFLGELPEDMAFVL